MAQEAARKTTRVKKSTKAPASTTKPEPSAFEKMRELTRRIVNVPKSDVPSPKPRKRTRGP
jgi:hypothetical protein